MNHTSILIGVVALGLTSCATQQDPAPDPAWAADVPPPEISIDIPLEKPEPGTPRFCQLGESCWAMDSRPFEPCLLSTQPCRDKIEPREVRRDDEFRAPPLSEVSAR